MEGSEKADDQISRLRHFKILTLSHCFPTDCDFVKETLSFISYLGRLSCMPYLVGKKLAFANRIKHAMHFNDKCPAMRS